MSERSLRAIRAVCPAGIEQTEVQVAPLGEYRHGSLGFATFYGLPAEVR